MSTDLSGKNLAGAMFWALPLDDFSGEFCGLGKFPLITSVVRELEDEGTIVPTLVPVKTHTQASTQKPEVTPTGKKKHTDPG